MKRAIFSVLVISFALLLKSCNTTEPPPPPPNGDKPTLELTLEDVSCIETWIKLKTTNLQLPATITLKQINPTGDSLSQYFILNTQDTLLYVDSLLPNKTYQYQVSSIEHQVSSNELSVTTMDTTSHDFIFETFTFGGTAGSSTLYDVAIINEDNIWAVGEILVADTSQNGYTMYNAVHWNGSDWKLKRIMFYTICGQPHQNAYAASSIFAFSVNDIWVAMLGSQIARLNDTTQIATQCIPISVRKLWGSDNQNIYAVGVNGKIAYYNGTLWTRIESGTEISIIDVFGVVNQTNNQHKVFCAVSDIINNPGQYKILTISENNYIDSLHWNLDRSTASTWSNNGWIVYASGGGVFNNKTRSWEEERSIPLYYTNRIRGNGLNDIFVVGDFALLAQFNGKKWNVYQELLQLPLTSFNSITVNENIIAIVGYNGEKALIIIGRRL